MSIKDFIFRILRRKNEQPALVEHVFFGNINKMLSYDINNLPITSTLKKRVVSCFLKILFTKIRKVTLDLCNGLDNGPLEDVSSLYINAIANAEEEALKAGVPEIFIERFRSWDSNHIDAIIDSMNQIASSKFHENDYEKLKAILDILNAITQLQLLDIEKTINSLNGELEKAIKGTVFDV